MKKVILFHSISINPREFISHDNDILHTLIYCVSCTCYQACHYRNLLHATYYMCSAFLLFPHSFAPSLHVSSQVIFISQDKIIKCNLFKLGKRTNSNLTMHYDL